jgi:hypothetical protein
MNTPIVVFKVIFWRSSGEFAFITQYSKKYPIFSSYCRYFLKRWFYNSGSFFKGSFQMTRTIPTPHDHFFRAAMSHPEVAKAFFETHLPTHILKYTEPTELLDLFDDPTGIMKDIVFSQFHLIDIGQIPDETLKEKAWLNVLQFCLKHAFARDFLAYMSQVIALWQDLAAKGEEGYIIVEGYATPSISASL